MEEVNQAGDICWDTLRGAGVREDGRMGMEGGREGGG